MKSKVEATQSKLEELKSEIEKESSNFDFIQADESVARKLQGDMAVIRNLRGTLRALTVCSAVKRSLRKTVRVRLQRHLNRPPTPFLAAKPVTELQKEREEWRAKR